MIIELPRDIDFRDYISTAIKHEENISFTVEYNDETNIATYSLDYEITKEQLDTMSETWPTRAYFFAMKKMGRDIVSVSSAQGITIIYNYMIDALLSGANDQGKALAIITDLRDVILALQLGALHAAIMAIDLFLQSEEINRAGYPFTSNAWIQPVRQQIQGLINE